MRGRTQEGKHLKGNAHNKPKTVGEALGVKGRNLIEPVRYKRRRYPWMRGRIQEGKHLKGGKHLWEALR